MFVSEWKSSAGRIFRYNLESKQKDIIYSQGTYVRSLVVLATNLWFLEKDNGVKYLPTNGGEAVTVNTTGLSGCTIFRSMYFVTGK